jgi:hypothetical protein
MPPARDDQQRIKVVEKFFGIAGVGDQTFPLGAPDFPANAVVVKLAEYVVQRRPEIQDMEKEFLG